MCCQAWLRVQIQNQAKRDDEIADIQSNINEMEDHTEMMRVESDQLRDDIALLEQSNGIDKDSVKLSEEIQKALRQVRITLGLAIGRSNKCLIHLLLSSPYQEDSA